MEKVTLTEFDCTDEETGDRIKLSLSPYYVIFQVNRREYYINRETGEFDGTGESALSGPTLIYERE